MWPKPDELIAQRMKTISERATAHGRIIDYGLRVHMIVRDTEQEAYEHADELVSQLDDEFGKEIRERALDAKNYGVAPHAANRNRAGEFGFIEPRLWAGVGRARSACGAALVGSVDQVLSKIEAIRRWSFVPCFFHATRICRIARSLVPRYCLNSRHVQCPKSMDVCPMIHRQRPWASERVANADDRFQ